MFTSLIKVKVKVKESLSNKVLLLCYKCMLKDKVYTITNYQVPTWLTENQSWKRYISVVLESSFKLFCS